MPDETNDAEPLNEPSDSNETQAPPTSAPEPSPAKCQATNAEKKRIRKYGK